MIDDVSPVYELVVLKKSFSLRHEEKTGPKKFE